MPELPEVETVRRTLAPRVLGRTLEDAIVTYAPMVRPDTPHAFSEALAGQTIRNIARYGKYLVFELDSLALIVHLRMEGKFFLGDTTTKKRPHEHIRYRFKDGGVLIYDDVRKFGTHTVKPLVDYRLRPPISTLGLEPGDPRLTDTYLKAKFNTTRTIKSALLDQTIILGLGNIYVDEVCFCAKIRPTTRANRLSKPARLRIIDCAARVIDKAVKLGGSSIRSYTDSLGVTGRFQNELNVHMREGEACPVCGHTVKKTRVAGRGTYYCRRCQKA